MREIELFSGCYSCDLQDTDGECTIGWDESRSDHLRVPGPECPGPGVYFLVKKEEWEKINATKA